LQDFTTNDCVNVFLFVSTYESMCIFHSLLTSHHSAFVLFLCIDVVKCTPQLIFTFHTQHVIIARSTTVFNE